MLISNEEVSCLSLPRSDNVGYEKVRPRVLDTLVILYKECG